MRFQIDDLFADIKVQHYEELYFDEPFNVAMSEALGLGRRLMRLDSTAKTIIRHVGYEPRRDPDSAPGRVFGASRAGFVEELSYDRAERRGQWRTIPSVLAERVDTAGTLELIGVDGGARRCVGGEVAVSLFGFGRLVERAIVREIETSYSATARFTRAWLAKP